MTVVEIASYALALLGLGAGLFALLRWMERRRVKLRVLPLHAIRVDDDEPWIALCIEVTNLSRFPVTVSEAGVRYVADRGWWQAHSHALPIDKTSWPRLLQPGGRVTVYGQPPQPGRGYAFKSVYARTACGTVSSGAPLAFEPPAPMDHTQAQAHRREAWRKLRTSKT